MKFEVSKLLAAECFDHPVRQIELIETHISWVVLTGDFAYKIKKPVNFGFLDFSTLKQRHHYCLEELRLNRRLAPQLYLDVVAIAGNYNRLVVGGRGRALEYAVKMAQFPQAAQLDNYLRSGQLGVQQMSAIGDLIARFHQTAEAASNAAEYGSPRAVMQPVEENFRQIKQHLDTAQYDADLAAVQRWSSAAFTALNKVFAQRKKNGFVRECHGDLHLRNMLWLHGVPLAFDCIEFNPELRWIDVISDIAFLVMDLHRREQPALATYFLNSYLEISGDYAGLSVLPFYLSYRALVRAKVDALRAAQAHITATERAGCLHEFETYLQLAHGYTRAKSPKLMIMCGLSASGKSTVSESLLGGLEAIRIRSDVERKRIFNVARVASAAAEVDRGIYLPEASEQTYARLAELTAAVIGGGYSVIVDAAFLRYEQRTAFQELAGALGVPYVILEVSAPAEVLRQRINRRENDVSDADLTVLENQLRTWQPLRTAEQAALVSIDTEQPLDVEMVLQQINRIVPTSHA